VATVIASPRNAEEISALLQYCDSEKLSVCPSGSRSKTSWLAPAATSLELNTTRMNTLREHPWQDMTCTVEAGCPWNTLQSALAQHGQFVALDPLWPERATVGGILAANDSGVLRVHYGGLRDLVIGMQVVLQADGGEQDNEGAEDGGIGNQNASVAEARQNRRHSQLHAHGGDRLRHQQQAGLDGGEPQAHLVEKRE